MNGEGEGEALNPELERAIAERPHDLGLFDVYADWLEENGNPRGELASVQLARERADSETLEKKEATLLERHADLLCGKKNKAGLRLDGYCNQLNYRGGFWRSVHFSGPADVLAEILAHPSARLLHALAVGYLDDDGESESYVAAITTIAKHKREALRVLRLGDMPEGQSALAGFGDRTCGELAELAKACPRLETLRFLCPSFEIKTGTTFPALRVIDARLGITEAAIASLAQANLPCIEELSFGFETAAEQDAMYTSILWGDDALGPLLTGKIFPTLKRLRLWPWPEDPSADALLERVKSSPLGQRAGFEVELCNDLEGDETADGSYTL